MRLNAFLAIRRQPGVSFNRLARETGVERGLLAYHLAVLKAAGIVRAKYERRSRQASEYVLTRRGEARGGTVLSSRRGRRGGRG